MRLTALCLVGALLAALLRRTGGEMALLLALAVCGAAVMLLAQPLEELKGFWEEAASWGQLPVQLFVPLVKNGGDRAALSDRLRSVPGRGRERHRLRAGDGGGGGGHRGVAAAVPFGVELLRSLV